jgi:uncharacterized protein (TIGR02246 family)
MVETTGTGPDLEAIERVRNAHIAALNADNVDGWVGQFAEHAVQMPPHFPANLGKQAIKAWSQGFLNLFRCQFALAVDEVRVAGDWAFERGRYTITLTPKGAGPPMDETGKYITIYERQAASSWKMTRDIWNSDMPLPGAP